MIFDDETCRLFDLFAGITDYPALELAGVADECAAGLKSAFNGAAAPMEAFAHFAREKSSGVLQETYTRTFDISPACTLYAGYHVFGDSAKRSAFMVRLSEGYKAHGFSVGAEMPDHISVILRFLSVAQDREFAVPLLRECLVPVVEKIDKSLAEAEQDYRPAFESLKKFLNQVERKLVKKEGK